MSLAPKTLLCHFRKVNPAAVQMKMESKSAPISAMWKNLLDKSHHTLFHEVLRIELALRGHPPYTRQHEFRSADHRFGLCCHIIATNRPLWRMSRFKIEPALILGQNFAKIVLVQSLEPWQELTTFCQLYGRQLARQRVWDPSNMKVFHPQRVVQAVQHFACETPKTSARKEAD
jgi:hypothetical protein